MFFFDPSYLLIVGPAIALAMWAQYKVKSAYRKYSQVMAATGFSGAEVAQRLLSAGGLDEVKIERVQGELTDHYDPRGKVLRLSSGVYANHSLAAYGIVAHEVGHAAQDAQSYVPMRIRASLVPAAGLGTNLGPILIIAGVFLGAGQGLLDLGGLLINIGIIAFAAATVFQLVTLPVEYNASSRAMVMLSEGGLISGQEAGAAKKVLSAAALTYLAAALAAITQLVYFLLLSRRR